MITIDQAWHNSTISLRAANIINPRQEALYLICAHLGDYQSVDASYVYQYADKPLPEAKLFAERLMLRCQEKPISRLMGRRAFWRDMFFINDDVFDPRADSEAIIIASLKLFDQCNSPQYILDMGCGSGCLLLSLLQEFPNAKGLGCDIDHKAIAVARHNAALLKLTKRCCWQQSNWWEHINNQFDLIVCNPPYIDPESDIPRVVSIYDPSLALFAHNHGLESYYHIIPKLYKYLDDKGVAIFESHPKQTYVISQIAMKYDLACQTPMHNNTFISPPDQIGLIVINKLKIKKLKNR